MRTRRPSDVAGRLAVPRRRHAVVVGGSLAGMLAARVLSDHFDGVTLLERDRFPEGPAARKGLPQGRHVHVLLERGRGALALVVPVLAPRRTSGLSDGRQSWRPVRPINASQSRRMSGRACCRYRRPPRAPPWAGPACASNTTAAKRTSSGSRPGGSGPTQGRAKRRQARGIPRLNPAPTIHSDRRGRPAPPR
jgi:hypothetical protein